MRVFPTSKRDNERFVMRLEFDANDLELLEEAVDRLRRLALIEDALGVKGFESPFIFGEDQPTRTREAAQLFSRVVNGWDTPGAGDESSAGLLGSPRDFSLPPVMFQRKPPGMSSPMSCPDCDGDGYNDIVDDWGGVVGPSPCETCGGTGTTNPPADQQLERDEPPAGRGTPK